MWRDMDFRFGWAIRMGAFLLVAYLVFGLLMMAIDRLPVEEPDVPVPPCQAS